MASGRRSVRCSSWELKKRGHGFARYVVVCEDGGETPPPDVRVGAFVRYCYYCYSPKLISNVAPGSPMNTIMPFGGSIAALLPVTHENSLHLPSS